MKLAYQLAMPDIPFSSMITSYQGELKEGFAHLKRLGYDAVELMVRNTDALASDTFRSLLDAHGLAVSMLATGELYAQEGLSLSSHDPTLRARCIEQFKQYIDVAAPLGAGVNIGRARGAYRDDQSHQKTFDLAIDAFLYLAEYAQAGGVMLLLEPVNVLQCNFIRSSAQGRAIIDLVNMSSFRLMLDVFHMNIEDRDICAEIEGCRNHCSYVHVSDNNRLYPGNTGALDFQAIVGTLRSGGYNGYLGVEVLQEPDWLTAMSKSAELLLPLLERQAWDAV